MTSPEIPPLSEQEISECLDAARNSPRRRYPKLLHRPGDEFNRVFNFMMQDSYMQPHLHPDQQKIEKIYWVSGKLAVLFFDDHGGIKECTLLQEAGERLIEVPAFTWHTYVMLSDFVITYETMMGVYEFSTWKNFANWAPPENSADSQGYLQSLQAEATGRMAQG